MKVVFSIIGMIIGVAIIVFGIYTFNNDSNDHCSGDTADYASFGADYYTYQYDATKKAADNIWYLAQYTVRANKEARTTTGIITILAGSVVICYFGCKLGGSIDSSRHLNISNLILNTLKSNSKNNATPINDQPAEIIAKDADSLPEL